MPRRGGGSRSPSPSRSTTTKQAPMRSQQTAPPQQQSKGGIFSGLGGVLAQGMAFGAGSEIAHQAIRSVTGSGGGHQNTVDQSYDNSQQQQQQQQQSMNKCEFENGNFINCLKANNDSISMCQSYFDMLKDCEKKFGN
mmetsp:Transcript_11212/g.9595  ORF Transcript_11212/g.9595 Transcript_11212/m.9595 type:complete len:138 (-) Transcript_11212:208-621(-)